MDLIFEKSNIDCISQVFDLVQIEILNLEMSICHSISNDHDKVRILKTEQGVFWPLKMRNGFPLCKIVDHRLVKVLEGQLRDDLELSLNKGKDADVKIICHQQGMITFYFLKQVNVCVDLVRSLVGSFLVEI